jgi:hypothetical protein
MDTNASILDSKLGDIPSTVEFTESLVGPRIVAMENDTKWFMANTRSVMAKTWEHLASIDYNAGFDLMTDQWHIKWGHYDGSDSDDTDTDEASDVGESSQVTNFAGSLMFPSKAEFKNHPVFIWEG